jgi:Zinc finger, C3HC4 type (RING finger)
VAKKETSSLRAIVDDDRGEWSRHYKGTGYLGDELGSNELDDEVVCDVPDGVQFDTPLEDGTVAAVEDDVNVKVITKDLKAMGLAAGGKLGTLPFPMFWSLTAFSPTQSRNTTANHSASLVQDIYRDPNPAHTWNTAAAKLVHIHILDPASCEAVTHVVPAPPPIDAMGYVEANMPFFVVEEQAENRVDGGDFENVISVSAMDRERGVATEPSLDPSKPTQCKCAVRLCDCVYVPNMALLSLSSLHCMDWTDLLIPNSIRPCNHQLCNVCVRELDQSSGGSTEPDRKNWKCPSCQAPVSYVAGFSAPMNLPGEEALKVRVPVNVLEVKDGRVRFKSVQTTRL